MIDTIVTGFVVLLVFGTLFGSIIYWVWNFLELLAQQPKDTLMGVLAIGIFIGICYGIGSLYK